MAKLWVALILFSTVFLSIFCNEVTVRSGSGSVGWCKNSQKNEWRHSLNEIFSGTAVKITESDCEDVGEGKLGLLITYVDGVKELLKLKPHQNIQNFFASALRKMSKDVVINISDKYQWDKLPKTVEYIVLYTYYADSTEHVLFQQAALSGRIPDDSILVTVHEVELLPENMKEKAKSSYHIWTVEGTEWSSLHLNAHHLVREQIREEFVNLMLRLKYSAIHTYNGVDPQLEFADSGLHPLMVFHYTDEIEGVYEYIIQPLVKQFRSFYVFVTMDVTKYPDLKEQYKIDVNETMPYIIIMDPRYTGGLHLDKETIAYTPERLRNYLKSLVIPEEHRNASNVKFRDDGVFMFDSKSLAYLVEEQEQASLLVSFCKKDTPSCQEMYDLMSKAVKEALSEHGARLDMLLCVTVVENLEDVEKFTVTEIPSVLLRYLSVWEAVTDNTVDHYVEVIKKFGRVIERHNEL